MMQILNLTKFLLLLLCISVTRLKSVTSYSQIAISGSNVANEGPKIYKAVNLDLIFPKTFNSSENVISTTAATTTTTTTVAMSNENPALYVTPASVYENAATASPPAASTELTEDMVLQQQLQQQQQQEYRQQQLYASTGRAINHHPTYPFSQLLSPTNQKNVRTRPATVIASPIYSERQRPASSIPSGINRIVYPNSYTNGYQLQRRPPSRAELNKLGGKGQIIDRFSPSEGVASQKFKNNKNHNHHRYPPGGSDTKVASASNQVITSYKPPKNLYSFPPNLDAVYPAPVKDPKTALPSNSITSYLPPPSGSFSNGALNGPGYLYMPPTSPAGPVMPPSNNGGYTYPGPIAPPTGTADSDDKMPPNEETKAADDGNGDGGADTDDGGNDDTIGVLPASAMDTAGDAGADNTKDMAGGGDDMPTAIGMTMDDHDDDHSHDHDHPLTGYDSNKEYPTPPPGWIEDHPEAAHDHPHDHGNDHDHDHDHFPSFPSWSGPSYPDIIYDDHFHHHHHPEPPPPPLLPETTVAPPIEPPPEPRVKKYSYFYIGRKLWYIPLYFTVWFSFYVLWLILKSIARHKVNLPNHYVNRRSLPDYTPPQRTKEYIDKLTVSVLAQIDGFKDKYL